MDPILYVPDVTRFLAALENPADASLEEEEDGPLSPQRDIRFHKVKCTANKH